MSKSAYNKRRRGEQPFLASECFELSELLNLEVRVLPSRMDAALGTGNLDEELGGDLGNYLEAIRALAARVTTAARTAQAAIAIRASSTDVPIVHFLSHPVLYAFKVYLFRSLEEGFSWPLLDAELESAQIDDGIFRGEEVFPPVLENVEIWGRTPLASLMVQLSSVVAKGAVTKPGLELLRGSLDAYISELELRLRGKRAGAYGTPLTLYIESSRVTSPQYVFAVRNRCWAVVTYDLPYFLTYQDVRTCAKVRQAFERRRRLATPVCDDAGMPVATFIRSLRSSVAEGFASMRV